MRFLPPIVANLVLMAAAFGMGSLLRPLLPKNFQRLDRISTVLLSGLGLMGTVLFLAGLIRFSLGVITSFLFTGVLLAFWSLRKEFKESTLRPRLTAVPRIPASVVALVLAVTFLGGLAEPVGDIKMDAIAYHFLGPRVWLRDAVIHVIPDECLTAFPASVETLYAALMAIGGTRAPEFFATLGFGLLLLVSYGFAVRLGLDRPGAWWAVGLIAAMPVVYRGSYGGFNDAIFSAFILLSLRLMLNAQEVREFILPGIFAGLAMGTKYTGIISFALIFASAMVYMRARRSIKPLKPLLSLLLLAVTSALVASPWYLRNWEAIGSPVYPPPPLLLHFFQIKYMSPQAIDALAALVHKEGLGMGRNFSSFLLLPFNFTFHPANFLNGPGGVGVSLLALAPIGLLSRWRDPFVRIIVFFCFFQVAAWFATEQEARFLTHVYVLLAVFAIYGWRHVAARSPRLGPLLAALTIACSILYGLIMIVPARVPDLHAAISPSFEKARKSQEIPYLDSLTFLNANPNVKKVLVLEPRVATFYLQKDYLKPIGRFGEQSVPEGNDPRLLVGRLSAYGITHILDVRLDDIGIHNDFRVPPGLPNLQLVFEREDQRVYQVEQSRH